MTITDIKVEGLDYKELTSIDITETAHAHGICELSFILSKTLDAAQLLKLDKTKITVKVNKDIIFCGIINRCGLVERVGRNILNVTALSLSSQMESARKSKTYQSDKKKCSDIANDVAKSYSAAEIDCWKDETISELIYRDNLTDWDFLKNLAERHGQILFVDSKIDKLKISIGFKAFKEFEPEDLPKLLSRNISIDFFSRLEQNTYAGARTSYFFDTTLETPELNIGVGSAVKYENKTQAVIASKIFVIENNLSNRITLRPAEGCRADAWDVMKHFDEFYYLTGKVLESKDNDVKIQFDCDESQNKDEALNIPFESNVNNYLYTMPDDGEKVLVYVDRIRQAAMTSLRTKAVEDKPENRSFKIKTASMIFDPKKFSFVAADKTELKHEDGTNFTTDKNITFSSKGDIIIQSAQGLVPDGQLNMVAPHSTGYTQYLAGLGQPATVQFNPEGSTVGQVDSQIKNAGSKAEPVELSELAKELDKITGRKDKKSDEQKSDGGSGGNLKLDGKKNSLLQVKDSSIEMEGSNLNVKTRALIQIGYIPMAGGGTGSLTKFEGGNPKNRSEKINVEHGSEDRSRIKENITPTPDDKKLSV